MAVDAQQLSQRLATQTWAWQDGRTGEVLAWLQQLGCRMLSRPEFGQTWMIEGIAGTNAALCRGHDPIATAQTIGILCGGMFWSEAFPDFLRLVNKEWAQRRTEADHSSTSKGSTKEEIYGRGTLCPSKPVDLGRDSR